jgi:hypothetical protein
MNSFQCSLYADYILNINTINLNLINNLLIIEVTFYQSFYALDGFKNFFTFIATLLFT